MSFVTNVKDAAKGTMIASGVVVIETVLTVMMYAVTTCVSGGTTIAFVAMIVNAKTVTNTATRNVTDVSVHQVNGAPKELIVAMDKAVSGCVVRGVANLAHYLRWPWNKY
eukprot:873184_1